MTMCKPRPIAEAPQARQPASPTAQHARTVALSHRFSQCSKLQKNWNNQFVPHAQFLLLRRRTNAGTTDSRPYDPSPQNEMTSKGQWRLSWSGGRLFVGIQQRTEHSIMQPRPLNMCSTYTLHWLSCLTPYGLVNSWNLLPLSIGQA